MRTRPTVAALGVLLMAGVAPALATDYTFTATEGYWDVGTNWSPPYVPQWPNDKATIGNGHTCRVRFIDPCSFGVKELTVDGGGTLTLDGGIAFFLGTADAGQTPQSTVNGTLLFNNVSENSPPLVYLEIPADGRFDLYGSGTITASAADGGTPGVISKAI